VFTVTDDKVWKRFSVRNGDLPLPSNRSRKYGFISLHLIQKEECVGDVTSASSKGSLLT